MKAFVTLVFGSLLVLLLAGGCYGSTPPMVKLGLLAPFEELYRADGYAVLPAVQLAIDQRNAAGGVAGRRVTLVSLNDNGRPDEAQRQAANLAVDADVLGVIGPLHAATAAAAGPALAEQGLPWLSLASLAPPQQPGGFSLEAPPAALLARAEALLQADGIADPLLVTGAGDAAQPAAGVIWLGDAAGGGRLARQLGPQTALVGGPELGSTVFAGRAGAASAGVRWLSAGPASDGLPADFVAAYQQLAGAPPSPQAALAYDATNLLLDAIALAGQQRSPHGRQEIVHRSTTSDHPSQHTPLSRPAVLRALVELGAAGWQGLSGPVAWQEAICAAQPCWSRLDPPMVVHRWLGR